jgi:hypothetical protein
MNNAVAEMNLMLSMSRKYFDVNCIDYCPIIAEATVNVPEYLYSKFIIITLSDKFIKPIGNNSIFESDKYSVTKLSHHKFWVVVNKNNFISAKSEADLADPNNIIGVGCFLNEKQDSKFFIFNIDGILFHGPAIFPEGGSYISLCNSSVINNNSIPDYNVLKNYLDDINNVEYWDFKKHA